MAGPNSNQFVDFPIFAQLIPREGPKAVPFNLDFTVTQSYVVDLQNQQSRSIISLVQAIFVDNSANTSPLSIMADVVGQTLIFPPQSQGYLPILVPNPPKLTFTSPGGSDNVKIILLNVPMPAAIWPAVTYIPPVSASKLQVADATLDGTVAGGLVNVADHAYGTGDATYPFWRGNRMLGVNANAAGNTVIFTPAVGNVVFFTHLSVLVSGNATLAAAGLLTIQIRSGAGLLSTDQIFLPAAVPAAPVMGFIVRQVSNLGFNGKTAGDALTVNLSAALTNGSVSVGVAFGETAIIG